MNEVRQFKGFKSTQSKTDQHIISLAFMFGLFMPNGTLFYYLVPVVIFLLGLRYSKFNNSIFNFKIILLGLMFFSFVLYTLTNTDEIDTKGLLRNIVLFELIVFFPFAKNVRIPNVYLYFAVIFIFISQISYMLGIGPIIKFFNTVYPFGGEEYYYQADYFIENASQMTLTNRSFRLGGLFFNPNQAARNLNIVFAVFLIENYSSKIKSILPFLIMYFLAIIATGSRTGFFITLTIFAYSMYTRSTNKKKYTKHITLIFATTLTFLFFYFINSKLTQTYRFLDYNEGLEKSMLFKIDIFFNVISKTDFLFLLFGNFSNDGLSAINLDSEWGELIYRYGVFFFISLIMFYLYLFKRTPPHRRIIFFILLWMISGALILSYRASFIFMLPLSKYLHDILNTTKTKKYNKI